MTPTPTTRSDSSLKVAIALALARFSKLHRSSPTSSSPSDAQRWKRKAKDRKREILKLREEIQQLEDGSSCEADLPIASCPCHFFGAIGESGEDGGGRGHWIDEVLRRRFLRLVRWKERRKKVERPLDRKSFLVFDNNNEIEQLGASINFLVEHTDNFFLKAEMSTSFAAFSHQAVDFIVASVKNILSSKKEPDLIEDTVNGLIMRLIRRMCTIPEHDGVLNSAPDPQSCVQHIIRKLGNEPFIGQRILLSVSQKSAAVVESLHFMDPFDESFPCLHGSMFLMIELMEFLISDYVRSWISIEVFDTRLLEEWIRSVIQTHKVSELFESRNGLYTLYIERVICELQKILSPLAKQGKLGVDILSYLTC
ncbi:protein MULTIPOLAR SPINDLE 1-like isoform X1 [Zingiber officinale]|nr:protein MULTIPOLAR SPINDLE 1-like isoform X1 [Zingiber officinale]